MAIIYDFFFVYKFQFILHGLQQMIEDMQMA